MNRLDFATALARDAGALAHAAFGRTPASLKGRHDVVTAMDAEVERFIRRAIADRYPDDAVLGEEEGGTAGERVWIIDPIDGTANYARAIPHYCVSIGYLERGVATLGVLFDPSHDRTYRAARGEGAFCNDERLAVSATDELCSATVECGWSTRRSTASYVALIDRVLSAGCAVRRAGSGALGLADVAAGRIEAYCELHINSWDCAAGIVLVREAGGQTSDFFAGNGLLSGNPLIAANTALCATLAGVTGIPTA